MNNNEETTMGIIPQKPKKPTPAEQELTAAIAAAHERGDGTQVDVLMIAKLILKRQPVAAAPESPHGQ